LPVLRFFLDEFAPAAGAGSLLADDTKPAPDWRRDVAARLFHEIASAALWACSGFSDAPIALRRFIDSYAALPYDGPQAIHRAHAETVLAVAREAADAHLALSMIRLMLPMPHKPNRKQLVPATQHWFLAMSALRASNEAVEDKARLALDMWQLYAPLARRRADLATSVNNNTFGLYVIRPALVLEFLACRSEPQAAPVDDASAALAAPSHAEHHAETVRAIEAGFWLKNILPETSVLTKPPAKTGALSPRLDQWLSLDGNNHASLSRACARQLADHLAYALVAASVTPDERRSWTALLSHARKTSEWFYAQDHYDFGSRTGPGASRTTRPIR
jgi:hypothetical protein